MNAPYRCAVMVVASLVLEGCSGGGTTAVASSSPYSLAPTLAPASPAIAPVSVFPAIRPSTDLAGVLPSALSLPQAMPLPSGDAHTPVQVQVHYNLLPPAVTSQNWARRTIEYISPNNTILTIVVTPVGGSSASPVSSSCTQASCVASFTANSGPTLLAFTLTDGTNTLATFSSMQIIQPATLNVLNFTPNPVVNSVTLTLANATVNAGTAVSDVLTVNALDVDGNTIVGSGNYTDINGKPLRLILTTTNSQSGGFGSTTIQGPSTINSPNHAQITAVYNGAWLDHSTISVTSSLPLAGTLGTATLTTVPTAVEYSDSLAGLCGLTAGPDGAIWFAECAASKVGRITTAGVFTNFYTVGTYPNSVAVGPDGNLWAPNETSTSVSRITPTGTITTFSAGFTTSAMPSWMAMGADGSMWFSEEKDRIGRITTLGGVTEYGTTSGATPLGITLGPDGNMWFTEYGGSRIGRITTNATITEFSTGLSAGAGLQEITTGSDGNLWFTERTTNRIGRITPAGVITEFSTNLTANAAPVGIVSGPDGNLWFGEDTGGKIGRITTSGTINEYGNGLTTGSSPQFVTVGPDGNIWIAEYNGARIARFVY